MLRVRKESYLYRVLLVLIVSLTTLAYYLAYPEVDINADTPTYLNAAARLFVHPYMLLDPARLPGYPLFLVLIYSFAGYGNLATVSYVQMLLFVLTALEVYLLALHIFRRPLLAFIVALLFGTNPTLLGYSKAIMSEGLAALLLTSLALTIVAFLQLPRLRTLCLVSFLLLALIFTRPEWLVLPLPLLALLVLLVARREGGRRRALYLATVLGSLVLIYGGLGLYIQQNALHNHYPGLTAVSSWNYMGKVLQYHMQDEVPPEQRAISRKLDACIARIDDDPFHVLPCVPELSNDQYDSAAGTFALSIIKAHPLEFALKSTPLFATSLIDYADVPYHAHAPQGPLGLLVTWLQLVQRALYWGNILFPLCAIAWLAWLIAHRKGARAGLREGIVVLILLISYGLLVTTLAGYRPDDYMRFHIVFDPLLIVFVWGSVGSVLELAGVCCFDINRSTVPL